jgi:hypothetical protein
MRSGDKVHIDERKLTQYPLLRGTQASGGERGCILEVFNAVGDSIAVVTAPVSAIEPLRANEVLSIRPFAHGRRS